MIPRNTIPIWLGIFILTSMFLIGQDAWKNLCSDDSDCMTEEFCGRLVGHCEGPGMCVVRPDACPLIPADPVCGCDGVTYSSLCSAAMNGVSVAYVGGCEQGPKLGAYWNSGCLSGTEKTKTGDEYPWCGDDVVNVAVNGSEIHLAHKNATYNCCVDEIQVTLEGTGNVLTLTEKEVLAAPCDCLCCYDVESTIVGLSPATYVIEYCWYDNESGGEVCHTEEVEIQ